MSLTIPPIVKVIPKGRSGKWSVDHYTPEEDEVAAESYKWHTYGAGLARYTQKGGTFAVLRDHSMWGSGEVVMSDTPMERESNRQVIEHAHGKVLIAGLGLGMVVLPLFSKKEATSILVVEKEQDVINLVLKHLKKLDKRNKLTVVLGDIKTYETTEKFDTIYFDIWEGISAQIWEDYKELKARFARNRAKGFWMSCWMREETRAMFHSENRSGW